MLVYVPRMDTTAGFDVCWLDTLASSELLAGDRLPTDVVPLDDRSRL